MFACNPFPRLMFRMAVVMDKDIQDLTYRKGTPGNEGKRQGMGCSRCDPEDQ